jgi:Peptidase M50B-like
VTSALRRIVLPLVVAFLAVAGWSSFVVYPLKIFVVFLHEISHGLAALATGGSIRAIGLTFDEGGVCVTEGGSRFLILNAGYLGSLCWGALLLVLAARTRRSREIVGFIGAFTLVVTLLYVRSAFGIAYGLATGASLLLVAGKLPRTASEVLLTAIGVVSCLGPPHRPSPAFLGSVLGRGLRGRGRARPARADPGSLASLTRKRRGRIVIRGRTEERA